jgi:hypothetical protein
VTEIAEIINKAREGRGQVWLKDYKNSAGRVASYRLQVHTASFYSELIQQTVEMLQGLLGAREQEVDLLKKEVAGKLLAGLQQRQVVFEEQHKAATENCANENPNLLAIPGGFMLRNVEVLEEILVTAAPVKKSSRVQAPRNHTQEQQLEKEIRDTWPLIRFGASFKLLAGKFATIYPAS